MSEDSIGPIGVQNYMPNKIALYVHVGSAVYGRLCDVCVTLRVTV